MGRGVPVELVQRSKTSCVDRFGCEMRWIEMIPLRIRIELYSFVPYHYVTSCEAGIAS